MYGRLPKAPIAGTIKKVAGACHAPKVPA